MEKCITNQEAYRVLLYKTYLTRRKNVNPFLIQPTSCIDVDSSTTAFQQPRFLDYFSAIFQFRKNEEIEQS